MNTNVTKITVLVFLALLASTLALQCIDDYGNAVDWYVVSKFPKLSGGDDALKAGHRYMYLDSDETFWTVSEKTINDYDGAVFHTLEPVYNSDVGYLMYNDAFPDTVHAHSTAGHTKGVVAWDSDDHTGFWLTHSVPHFPPARKSGWAFPKSGEDNGQHLFCVSLDWDNLNTVGLALQHDEVWQYAADGDVSDPPHLAELINGARNTKATCDVTTLTTVGGEVMKLFSKSAEWDKNLYEDGVAPDLKSALIAETWMRPFQPDFCAGINATYTVENAETVHPPSVPSFKYTKDHSKVVLSSTPGVNTVCLGDINRDDTQKSRGGGTLCIRDTDMWHAFYTVFGAHRSRCPKP